MDEKGLLTVQLLDVSILELLKLELLIACGESTLFKLGFSSLWVNGL
jgi:hypothetical protein